MLTGDSNLPPVRQFTRFVLWGGFNTVITYLLYLLLSEVVHYQLAYLVSYLVGIALAYGLNLRLVFGSKSSMRKIVRYPLIYALQYLVGAALLHMLVSVLNVPGKLAPLLLLVALVPLSYVLNRRILAG